MLLRRPGSSELNAGLTDFSEFRGCFVLHYQGITETFAVTSDIFFHLLKNLWIIIDLPILFENDPTYSDGKRERKQQKLQISEGMDFSSLQIEIHDINKSVTQGGVYRGCKTKQLNC